jgi:hypothetical protein
MPYLGRGGSLSWAGDEDSAGAGPAAARADHPATDTLISIAFGIRIAR